VTTPTTTQAEREAADLILTCAHTEEELTRDDIANIIAAHRSAPPSDPAVAHVAKLENELGGMIAFMATRYTTGRGFQILEHARALLATLDAERKVTK